MRPIGYRVFCRDRVREFADPAAWAEVPDGSVLVAVMYYERSGVLDIAAGAEHYYMDADGRILGVDDPADAPPGAVVREGYYAPDHDWDSVYAQAMEARAWRP